MIINDPEISVFNIAEEVKKVNAYIYSDIKAYDFMSNNWYYYNIGSSFWRSIEECVKDNLQDYHLWIFIKSTLIQDTRISRYKGCAKKYILEGKKTGAYRGYEVVKEESSKNIEKGLRFYNALELTHNKKLFNPYVTNVGGEKYFYIFLPQDIDCILIQKLLENNWNLEKKRALEIDKVLYEFLISNKGVFIEAYGDANYYEYRGEETGYILIDPFGLCPVERSAHVSAYNPNVRIHQKYDVDKKR